MRHNQLLNNYIASLYWLLIIWKNALDIINDPSLSDSLKRVWEKDGKNNICSYVWIKDSSGKKDDSPYEV